MDIRAWTNVVNDLCRHQDDILTDMQRMQLNSNHRAEQFTLLAQQHMRISHALATLRGIYQELT